MIAAIILAAGLSSRMGTNKLVLPLKQTTVIQQIVKTIAACDVGDLVVVTGHERDKIESALGCQVRFVHNVQYAHGEMLSSIQAALRVMLPTCTAALITPGDQPLIEAHTVAQIIASYAPGQIIIPSYQHRGGHPILIDHIHWPDILAAPAGATLRAVIRAKPASVRYLDVQAKSILYDMDTPGEYQQVLDLAASQNKPGNKRIS